MRRSLGHLLNKELSRGWKGWTGMIAARAEHMQKLDHAMRHMLNRKLGVGFGEWGVPRLVRVHRRREVNLREEGG